MGTLSLSEEPSRDELDRDSFKLRQGLGARAAADTAQVGLPREAACAPRGPELRRGCALRGSGLPRGAGARTRGAVMADMHGSPSTGGGVRARARGMLQKAGEWPCKLASVSASGGVHASKKNDDRAEGLEMLQRMNGEYVSTDCSPTSVADMAAWGFMPRGALCLDSVAAALQGSAASSYLAAGEGCAVMGSQRHGGAGGLFSSIRGAHSTWQPQSESDASNTRQKHALSMALSKNRGGSEAEEEKKPGPAAVSNSEREVSIGNESLMGILMRGLHEEKHAFASMTRNAPAGYTGVRASAFALVTSNAAAGGHKASERACEPPPRVPLHRPSTKEGVSQAKAASRPRSDDATSKSSSTLQARRTEATVTVRQPICKNTEW